jgi:hypothetical protein
MQRWLSSQLSDRGHSMKRGSHRPSRPTALFLCATSSLLVGCKKLDSAEIEMSIDQRALGRGWYVSSVSCPTGLAMKRGHDFSCTLRFDDGQKLEIKVKQTDDDGHVEWEPVSRVIPIHDVEGQLVKTWPDVKLTCEGKHELIVVTGETMPCTAEHGGTKSAFDVVSDGDGWTTVPVPTYR